MRATLFRRIKAQAIQGTAGIGVAEQAGQQYKAIDWIFIRIRNLFEANKNGKTLKKSRCKRKRYLPEESLVMLNMQLQPNERVRFKDLIFEKTKKIARKVNAAGNYRKPKDEGTYGSQNWKTKEKEKDFVTAAGQVVYKRR